MQSAAGKLIGVLGLQGSIVEHVRSLRSCGADVLEVLKPEDLNKIQGLVIPGGESTTLSKLMKKSGLFDAVKRRASEGMPIYGTCAGMILLSQSDDREMEPLKLMDIEVDRNAYGRQVDSFRAEVDFMGEPIDAVFIRAPKLKSLGPEVEVLAKHGETPIMCRQGRLLASSFHPELTKDTRVHEYFLSLCT